MIIYYEYQEPINLYNVESMGFPDDLTNNLSFYMNSGETLHWQFRTGKERKRVFDYIRKVHCHEIPKQK